LLVLPFGRGARGEEASSSVGLLSLGAVKNN